MSIELNKIEYLRGELLSEESRDAFIQELLKPKGVNRFDCSDCGAERISEIEDPGYFIDRKITCAEANTTCRVPPRPRAEPRPYFYVPGSLVYVPWKDSDPRQKNLWPAMVDFPVDSVEGYIIHGKTPKRAKAYHVILIMAHMPFKWLGGYIRASDIIPFTQEDLGFDYRDATPAFKAAKEFAASMAGKTLKERILTFSYISAEFRRTGLPIPPKCVPDPQWMAIIDSYRSQVTDFKYSVYEEQPKKRTRSTSPRKAPSSEAPARTRQKYRRTSANGVRLEDGDPEETDSSSESD